MTLVSYPHVEKEVNLPVYITGVGIGYSQLSVSDRTLPSPQILITVGGCGVVTVDGRKYEIPSGCGFYISKGVSFSFEPKIRSTHSKRAESEKEWLTDWVSFEITSDDLREELFTDKKFSFFCFGDPAAVSAGIRKIRDIIVEDTIYGGFSASAEMYDLLIKINRDTLEIPRVSRKQNPTVDAVIKYIEDNFTSEITLTELCEAAGRISEQYLCRLFKQHTGERPIEFILHKRINMARSYLEKTDMTIPDIAKLTGYNNTSYFYRNFKKFTGMSPLTCRQRAMSLCKAKV